MAVNSLFAQLLLALQEQIKQKAPSIRWIDQDLGQLEDYDPQYRPAVSFPCVLIDFNQTTYEQWQRGKQLGNLTFTLRLGFASFSTAASTAPLSVKEKALEMYEIEQELYLAIQGFEAGGLMQDCTRINSSTERREDNLRVRVLTFTSQSEDSSAMLATQKQARPTLQLEHDPA